MNCVSNPASSRSNHRDRLPDLTFELVSLNYDPEAQEQAQFSSLIPKPDGTQKKTAFAGQWPCPVARMRMIPSEPSASWRLGKQEATSG